jgi:DNA-binding GntR family transcriptional regulator
MQLERVDTKRAYERIRERITTLELPPGSPINEQQLADDLDMGLVPVREALKLLAHDNLVVITPRHGLYVADVNVPDLEQLSEMRLTLEGLSARLAAQRATADDIVVLQALRLEQAGTPAEDSRRLFDLDHKFHQAIAQAAHNKYLADSLEGLFGLSQRLWYLALPNLGFLPSSVEIHLQLVEAIEREDADQAEQIMRKHVAEFYAQVRETLSGAQGDLPSPMTERRNP